MKWPVKIIFLNSTCLSSVYAKSFRLLLLSPFILIFQLQSCLLFSQRTPTQLLQDFRTVALRDASSGLSYDDIEGSPYYNDDFNQGTVYLNDSSEITLPLRYDMYQDEVEFKQDGTVYWVIKSDVDHIRYGEDTLVAGYTAGNQDKTAWFFVRGKSPYSLYIRKTVEFSPYEPAAPYADPKPNRFGNVKDVFYLKKENNPPIMIDSRRDLTRFLEGNEKAQEYLKKNWVRINEEELTELVRFLNHH